jgi:hypothetical protein
MSSVPPIERKQRAETKAAGRARFVLRGTLGNLATGLVILLALALFHSLSLKESFLFTLILLPILLVGGYLTAVWQWQDLEKKYLEDRLPPWD